MPLLPIFLQYVGGPYTFPLPKHRLHESFASRPCFLRRPWESPQREDTIVLSVHERGNPPALSGLHQGCHIEAASVFEGNLSGHLRGIPIKPFARIGPRGVSYRSFAGAVFCKNAWNSTLLFVSIRHGNNGKRLDLVLLRRPRKKGFQVADAVHP